MSEETPPPLFQGADLDRIRQAFNERVPNPGPCPLCGIRQWTVDPTGIVFLVLQKNLNAIQISGKGVPCIAVACSNCGNTLLVNLMALGIGDLLPYLEQSATTPTAITNGG